MNDLSSQIQLTHTLILAPGSHAPGVAARPLDQLCLGWEDKGGPKAEEQPAGQVDSPAADLHPSRSLVPRSTTSRRQWATGALSRVQIQGQSSG